MTGLDTRLAGTQGLHLFLSGQLRRAQDGTVSPFEMTAIRVMSQSWLGSRGCAVDVHRIDHIPDIWMFHHTRHAITLGAGRAGRISPAAPARPNVRFCEAWHVCRLRGGPERAQHLGMMNFTELASVPSDHLVPFTDQLRRAVAAYLARFKRASREHTESDLRCYLSWCAERGLDPLAARRPHLELYIRWMQEIRRWAWTCGTCRSLPGTPIRGPRCVTTWLATTSIATRTTYWPPTWPPAPDRPRKAAEQTAAQGASLAEAAGIPGHQHGG
jgi:hypothetical protein